MKNRTYVTDIVSGTNLSVFGLVVGSTEPKKTSGSDYQMIINIMDESSKQKISVQLFLESEDRFPKFIVENETIIKIENLNMKENNERVAYLVDRKKGCFFFEVKKERVSYSPYFECNQIKYKEGAGDRKSLESIHAYFINEIPIGPKLLSTIIKVDSVFTVYGYIKDVLRNSAITTLVMCDPSTEKELRVRIWKRDTENFPEKDTSICIFNIKVKKIDQISIIADVSKSMNLIWTDKVPKDVQMLFDAYRMVNSKQFIDAVINKINKLNDNLENPALIQHTMLEETSVEKNKNKSIIEESLVSDSSVSNNQALDSAMPNNQILDNLVSDSEVLDNISQNRLASSIKDAQPEKHIKSNKEVCKTEETVPASAGPIKRLSAENDVFTKKPPKKLSIDSSSTNTNSIPSMYEVSEEDIDPMKKIRISACQKNQRLLNLCSQKKYCFSFKETDTVYEELINLPIKQYYTNPNSKAVTFDKTALLILDRINRPSEKSNIVTQHIAFFKKTPIIFHMCKRSSSISGGIAGYIFVFNNLSNNPKENKTLHVLLYTTTE